MKKILMVIAISSMMIINSLVGFADEGKDDFYIEYNGNTYQYTNPPMNIKINGTAVKTGEMPAIVLEGRTLVPVREVFESEVMGAMVTWNGENSEVTIIYKDKFIVLKIDSNTAYVNGKAVTLDAPPMLIKDITKTHSKTMIPLRFVTENFGFDVDWDSKDPWAVKINDKAIAVVPKDPVVEEPAVEEPDVDEPTLEQPIVDKSKNDGEKLDSLTGEKAENQLPTVLFSVPIPIKPDAALEETQIEPVGLPYDFEASAEDHDTVPFVGFKYHSTAAGGYFDVIAEGPISAIKSMSYWDGKLILEIEAASFGYNTTSGVYTQNFEGNPYVESIRSSQQPNDNQGNKILKVIFDLVNDEDKDYMLRISEDREHLYVGKPGQMVQAEVDNTLNELYVHQNDIGDYVDITYGLKPEVDVFRLSAPNRIVFDLRDTVTKLNTKAYSDVGGQYLSAIRTAQFGIDDPDNDEQNEFITRIVLETTGQAEYEIIQLNDQTIRIQLKEPNYENISYENTEVPTIKLEDIEGEFEFEGITYQDHYRDLEYIITIPGNFASNFGSGNININDGLIESMHITQDEEGNTKVIIKEKEVAVFTVEKVEEEIFIKAYKPSEVYKQVIVIDPGHGGKDPGAMVGNYEEADINLAMVQRLKDLLDLNNQIKVYYTRLDDSYVTLQQRVDLANQVNADFYVSIHNNAYVSTVQGIETLYFKDDPTPSLNGFELAEIIHSNVIAASNQVDRGTKHNNTLFVLRHTKMPAILLECGFMTNSSDLAKIIDPAHQQKLMAAVYEGIVETLIQHPINRDPIIALPVVPEPMPSIENVIQ